MPGNRVLVVCEDLFFWSRIRAAADDGIEVLRVADEAEADRVMRAGGVIRVLVDLGGKGMDVVAWAGKVAGGGDRPELVGFYSHLHDDVGKRAREAGFDRVLAKSKFVADLRRLVGPGRA